MSMLSLGVNGSLPCMSIEAQSLYFLSSSVQCWNPDENLAALHFRYAILFAQRGANLDLPEEILNNNYILVDIERIINCTLQRLDLEVLNFNLSNGDTFSRGQGMEFILRTEVLF